METLVEIKQSVKQYILQEFLPGEAPENLTDSVQLVRGAILDSMATLKLVNFLEQRFGIQVEAHEASAKNLNTLDAIAALVERKQKE